jgi:hypothetical protein
LGRPRKGFAIGFSIYIVVGVFFEERALRAQWGARYDDYSDRVGAIVPRVPRGDARGARGEIDHMTAGEGDVGS